MPILTMTSFVTLDGVMQGPGGTDEDTSGGFDLGGWVVPYAEPQFGEFMVAVTRRAGAFLLGRGTYEMFAAHWPKVTDPDDPIAAALNGLPKYVASTTLSRATWKPSEIVRDPVAELPRLGERLGDRELQVHGSPGLAQTLLRHGLVDELNLLTFPVILGKGKRLFGDGVVPTAFELTASRTTPRGVTISTFRRAGRPTFGTIEAVDHRERFQLDAPEGEGKGR